MNDSAAMEAEPHPWLQATFRKSLHAACGSMLLEATLEAERGEWVALFGASGAGKTTLLRMLAGLTAPDTGRVTVDGQTWFDSGSRTCVPVRKRRVGFVFQDYALFPNMTVRGNIEFAQGRRRNPAHVNELLEAVGLGSLHDRKPEHLSGGQQQRVALARALAARPQVLLLDEPLSALDSSSRRGLQQLLLSLRQRSRPTLFLVSHDLAEVMRLADRVLVMERGRITAQGAPLDPLGARRPQDSLVLNGRVVAMDREMALVVAEGRILRAPVRAGDTLAPGDPVLIDAGCLMTRSLRVSASAEPSERPEDCEGCCPQQHGHEGGSPKGAAENGAVDVQGHGVGPALDVAAQHQRDTNFAEGAADPEDQPGRQGSFDVRKDHV